MTREAVELLEQKISSLPDPEFGVINLLPFAVDSPETNGLRHRVCEAIVDVLNEAGLLKDRDQAPTPMESVTLTCRQCSTTLMTVAVFGGVANVPAASMISQLAKLHPECPHKLYTPDDQRQAIQQAVLAAQG